MSSPSSESDRLESYRRKRDSSSTTEPSGDGTGTQPDGEPRFVIRKHDARSLHYDFRLEIDGVLVSWAVPKGPSTDPGEKRLAIRTEDHPLDYADFEGVIPEGEYGAGAVLVWDAGTFRNGKEPDDEGDDVPSLAQGLEEGHLTVRLDGVKLKGGYALIRTERGEDDGEEDDDVGRHWLLVKMDDEEADARRNPVGTEPLSVLTGRGLDEIRAAAGRSATRGLLLNGDDPRYAGKVVTGYDEETLERLSERLKQRKRPTCPFVDFDGVAGSARWTRPELVWEVGFIEWTEDGKLRHPRFLGLRRDKRPREVVRETHERGGAP